MKLVEIGSILRTAMDFLDNFDAAFGEVEDEIEDFGQNILNIDDSDDEELLEIEAIRIRKEYRMYPRIDHMHMWEDSEFLYRFRLSKRVVAIFLPHIEDQLKHRDTFINR